MADDTGTGTPSAAPSSGAPPAAAASSTESASASATATPATSGAPVAQDPGEPPKERWPEILANARTKAEAEARSKWEQEARQKYGRFEGFDENPYGFAESLLDQLAQHPQYQQQVYAKAARLLQSRRGANVPQVTEEPQPDVPIVDGAGNVTGHTYSAKQLKVWREWDWAQREQTLSQRFAPLEQLNQRIQQAEQTAQIQYQADTTTKATLETLRQDPFFTQHEAAIKAEFAAHEEYGDNIHAAYVRVLTRDVLPTLSQTEQRKVLDSLQSKAAGATVNPGSQASTPPKKFKDFGEALKYFNDHPDEAAAMAQR